ncbi:MAG: undecaprenyl-diphosphate phosphatase [Thermoplasmata archaeon]
MEPLHALLLGIVQGITEWLPVSSSGHLVLLQRSLGLNVPVFFDLVLHVATVMVVIVAFRGDIGDILRSLISTFRLRKKGMSFREILATERPTLLAWFIFLGSIPTAIIGFGFRDFVEPLFSNLTAVGLALLVTASILLLTLLSRKRKDFMGATDAVFVGVMQGISIVPGVSRSGSIISVGMLRGMDRELAARYAFLLSIPAILGAAAFEFFQVMAGSAYIDLQLLAIAFLSSLLFGYLSLRLLWFIVKKAKLHYFSAYCFALGILVLLYGLL